MQKEGDDATKQSVSDMLKLFVVLWTVGSFEVKRSAVVLVQARVGKSGARKNGIGDGRQRR